MIKSPIVALTEASGSAAALALDCDTASMASTRNCSVAKLRAAGIAAELDLGHGWNERSAQIRPTAQEPDRRHPGLEVQRDAPGGLQVTICDLKLSADKLAKVTKDRADVPHLASG